MGIKATQNYEDLTKLTAEQLLYHANIEIGILTSERDELRDRVKDLEKRKECKNIVKSENTQLVTEKVAKVKSFYLGLLRTSEEKNSTLKQELQNEKLKVTIIQRQLLTYLPKK